MQRFAYVREGPTILLDPTQKPLGFRAKLLPFIVVGTICLCRGGNIWLIVAGTF